MKKQGVKNTKSRKMTSLIARRNVVKKLVKQALSRVLLRKMMNAEADQEAVEEHAEGGLIPGSCGVIVNGEFVPLTRGFLVNSATVPYYLPVVDNHWFLLGEFSKLDDLSICPENECSYSNTWF